MPRIARLTCPGVVYHVISRFSDREWRLRDPEERQNYLRLLGLALVRSDWRCLAYALMSNHIHLAMVAGRTNLWRWAKRVHSPFARWMNERHGRLGNFFADRPKSFAVLPENEGKLIAYIHNNPVRAGVVEAPQETDWTSHRAYIGLTLAPQWLVVDEGLRRSGVDEGQAFDAWVRGVTTERSEDIPLQGIHRAARRRGAIELATPLVGGKSVVPVIVRPFARIRPDPRRVIQIVSALVGVPQSLVCSRRRIPTLVLARQTVVHTARAFGIVGSDIAAALGVSPQAVSKLGLEPLGTTALHLFERTRHHLDDESLARDSGDRPQST